MTRHNRDLYQVSFRHVKPQQVGEVDYHLRSNKHQDVVCSSFQEALDAAQTGMNDYVVTGVRRVGSVVVVERTPNLLSNKSTPDINVKVGLTD